MNPKYIKKNMTIGHIKIKINEGKIEGLYCIKKNWAELFGIKVLKKHQHKGHGRKLIKLFEKEVKKLGITKIELFANVETLGKFIGRMGYKQEKLYRFYQKKLK